MRTYPMEEREDSSKYYYLYRMIRQDIESGELGRGEKLPSKRTLAEHLGISLITVENAYQLLKDEGYIETRPRSGYYVCDLPVITTGREGGRQLELLPLPARAASDLSEEGAGEKKQLLPYSLYFKTVRSVMTEYGEELLQKSPAKGCAILRNSIARYLLRYRGLLAQPARIIIGSGAEHLYGAVVRMLGNDKIYGIEDPSYVQIEKVYRGTGACVEKLAMGSHGITGEALAASHADVLHVTPFHSYPSGVTATISKRYEYLEWAHRGERYIVEDDFDSEFFMPGKPVETLYRLDEGQRVIYINTFSNSLSPSLRMGYMILPESLMELYEKTSGDFSCTVPVLEQYTLAEFIDKGYFEQHLNRVRRYRKQETGPSQQ